MITIERAFRRCLRRSLGNRSLVFTLGPILNFRFLLSGVEIRSVVNELFVWGIRGDFLVAFSFV
jgi:hypothetical protein